MSALLTCLQIDTTLNKGGVLNNIISVSGGNDSMAMLLVIDRIRTQDRIDLINDLEVKITDFRKAKYRLIDHPNKNDEMFGIFTCNKTGGNQGIVKQVAWAKERLESLNARGEEKQHVLFDEVVIDDVCKSGYCGT